MESKAASFHFPVSIFRCPVSNSVPVLVQCVVNVLTFPDPRNPTRDACYLPFCLPHFSLDTPTHSW